MRTRLLPVFSAFAGMLLFLAACGGNAKNEETVKTDTVAAVAMDPGIEKMLPLFKESAAFPYTIDTVMMNHVQGPDSLGITQVKLLSAVWFTHALNESVSSNLDDFYTIDSVTDKGLFSKWAERLDIGMTKFARAYALHKVKIDEKTWLLTWALETSSYEACPYSSSTQIMGTLVYNGKAVQSCALGEILSAGDPPVSMNRLLTAEVKQDGSIRLQETVENDDMDAEFSTRTVNTFQMTVNNGRFEILKEEKGKEQQVPHPAVDATKAE